MAQMLVPSLTTPLQSSLGTEGIAILVAAFVAGLVGIYWGFRTYRIGRLIRDTPTEKVKSVAIGRTELEGTAVPDEYVFDRPFTEGKCLYASYSIEEYREDPDPDNDDKDWETVLSNTVAAPFYIDDGTGEILVDADSSATFEISDEYTEEITVNGNPPAKVDEFLSGEGGGPTDAMTDTVSNLFGSMGGFGGGGGAGPAQSTAGASGADGDSGQPGPAIAQDEEALEALQSMDESEMKAIQRGERDPPPELEQYMGEDGDMTQLLGSMGGMFGGEGGTGIAQGFAQQGGEEMPQQSGDGPGQQQSQQSGDGATQQGGGDTGQPGNEEAGEQTLTHVPRTDLNSGGAIVDTSDEYGDSDGDDSLLGTLKSTASTVSDFTSAGGVSDSHRKRRYEQEVLPVEEKTYVYGAAKQRNVDLSASNEERVRIAEDDGTGEFIVSDYSESEIASTYTKRAILYIVGGLVVSAGALGFLANGLL